MEEKESNRLATFVATLCIKISFIIPMIVQLVIFTMLTMLLWNTVGVHLTGMESLSFIEVSILTVWVWFVTGKFITKE
jgi:hypothetical protein